MSALNQTTLQEDFSQIVDMMPYRNPIGPLNNFVTPFSEKFGVPQFVCGDQATYMAAALAQRGYEASVIYGEDGPFNSTHAWVDVRLPNGNTIELDPWNNKFGSDNRSSDRYNITGSWTIPKNQAADILNDYNNGLRGQAPEELSKPSTAFANVIPETLIDQLALSNIVFDKSTAEIASAITGNIKEFNRDIGIS